MNRRVLVVVTSHVGAEEARQVAARFIGDDAEMQVVAPASGLSRLDWLANAEDDARADAQARVVEVADALPGEAVATQVGDTDPLQAIADALATFPAEEIVMVTGPGDDSSWLESDAAARARERFDLPITHLVAGTRAAA